MARIRTIKPEFTQSESIGRLTRDARLLFIQIWTLVDDSGRARASSRGLASALYPFDDDARSLIDNWLCELVTERLISRYEVDGSTYLEVKNWRKHQKIDRPSPSRLPGIDEASRVIVEPSTNPRESLAADLVPSTLDLVPVVAAQARLATKATRWKSGDEIPSEWLAEANEIRGKANLPMVDPKFEAEKFIDFWTGKSGKDATKADWHATWRNWIRNSRGGIAPNGTGRQPMGPA